MKRAWHITRYVLWIGLWLSLALAAAAWILLAYATHNGWNIPPVLERLTLLSALAALAGSCLAVLFLLLVARTSRLVALGLFAAAANAGYYCFFAAKLTPP